MNKVRGTARVIGDEGHNGTRNENIRLSKKEGEMAARAEYAAFTGFGYIPNALMLVKQKVV